jgi:hypothetical protein
VPNDSTDDIMQDIIDDEPDQIRGDDPPEKPKE